jgi:transcription initiation factor IIF auxiliary subunit
MNVQFNSYSMFTEKKSDRDWYEWCVYVDGDKEVMDHIQSVEYRLHPTFPDPLRTITQKQDRFALFSSGWGGFVIRTRVKLSDGSEETGSYTLDLNWDDWPRKKPSSFESPAEEEVYQVLMERSYRWRKLNTIMKRTNLSESEVRQTLDTLSRRELARMLPYRSIDNQEQWGATALVGISPRL